jgi:hypothetical protein
MRQQVYIQQHFRRGNASRSPIRRAPRHPICNEREPIYRLGETRDESLSAITNGRNPEKPFVVSRCGRIHRGGALGELKAGFESQWSRLSCEIFSIGLRVQMISEAMARA